MISDANGLVTGAGADKVISQAANQAPDPETYEELVRLTASLSDVPLYVHNKADLLIDGPATYDAMLAAIETAESSIHLETYIFSDDEVGKRFANRLMQKARDNIAVRVIYDSLGSVKSDDAFFSRMRDAGIELVEFHNLNPLEGGNPLNFNVRDHRKLLMVDGEVAFTGGINLSNTYSSSSTDRRGTNRLTDGWRDTHIGVRGPAVAGFERVFYENWLEHGGGQYVLPETANTGQPGSDMIAILDSEGGDGQESAIFHAYMDAMATAQHRIWITQAYFAPDDQFLDGLKAAARRGVDVLIIVPGVSDSKLVLNASRSRYEELLKGGIRIYESSSSLLHAKTAVIDSVWSTVGSSNLDYRSFLHNDEVNAVIFGSEFARQMEQQFHLDTAQSHLIELEEWERRGAWQRLAEWASWPLEYWL